MPSHEDRQPAPPSAQTRDSGQAKSSPSPPRPLRGFFAKSRAPGKAQGLEAKTNGTSLRHRRRFCAKSNDRWKPRVRDREADLATLAAHGRARDNASEA